MAAASTIIMGVGAVAGGITSGALAIGGNNRRKRAEAELKNLVPPELRNAYSDVPLSTYGSRIASENLAQNNSNMLLAGQRGGIRALSSLAPTLTQANIQQNQAIALDIDNQYRQNKINEAQGQMQVQNMIEERYRNTLAGLQQERSAGLQDTYTGLSNLSQSIMAGGSAIANAKNGQKVDKLELDGASKQGANPFGQFQLTNGMNNQQMQDFNQNLYSQNNQDIVNPFNNYPINNPFAGMQNSQSNAPLDFSFVRYGERKGY